MTTTVTETLTTARRGGSATAPRRRRTLHRAEARGAWVLMSPYVLLFLVAAAIPIGYAFYISLQKPATLVNPQTGFGGLDAFVTVVTDYRFIGTFVNIFSVMIIWLPLMIVGVVGLALLIHASPGRFGGSMRFIYFVPGALAGIANFVLWVYLLNPSVSPIAFVWRGMGLDTLKEITTTENLPWILTAMLFFQGVGTWIIIVNGGLNGIPGRDLRSGLARRRQRVADGVAHQAAADPAMDRLRGPHESGVRLPAVPRALSAAADLVGLGRGGMGADPAGVRLRLHQPQLPCGGRDVDHPARHHARHRNLHRVPQRPLRRREGEGTLSAVTQLPVDRPVADHPVGRRRWNAGRIARVTVMAVVAAMFVIPIVGFIAMAFRNQAGVAADSDGWLGLQGMSWDNVVYSWSQITGFGPVTGGLYQRWILNSLILSVAGGVLALIAALPAGYALARLRFGSRKFWLFATLLAMVMPNTVLVIPLFLEVNAVGAVGQLWPVAVSSWASSRSGCTSATSTS